MTGRSKSSDRWQDFQIDFSFSFLFVLAVLWFELTAMR
jgi:hypothetical protein